MLVSGNFFQVQINYEPFQEKPPLFFWLQSVAMKLFGVNEFSARLPNALFGICSLLILFKIGSFLKNSRFGWTWSLVYLGSLLPHIYYKSGIIDPVFNLFIFLSIYFLANWISSEKNRNRCISAFFSGCLIGLAVITKGPVGFLLLLLTVLIFWLLYIRKVFFSLKELLIFGLSFLFISAFWFGHEFINNGPWFLVEFVKYQLELFSEPVAGHQQPIYYHFVVVFFGCMPISVLALTSFLKPNRNEQLSFDRWMKVLFWVVLILFTIVSTKIVHYSSMCYLPLSYLAAMEINNWERISKKWLNAVLIIVGLLISSALFAIPYLANFQPELLSNLVSDKFILSQLELDINWNGFEWMISIVYLITIVVFVVLLHKKYTIGSLIALAFGLGCTVLLLGKFVLPKIELYTQGPAIEFYQSIQSDDAYVTTVGYKSYAHLFYTKINSLEKSDGLFDIKIDAKREVMQEHTTFNQIAAKQYNSILLDWFKNGTIDKPVYFISRVDRNHMLDENENISLLYKKGGFVFYKRTPKY